jgi:hypothetical protein
VPRLYFEAGDGVGGYLAYSDDAYTKAETDAAIAAAATGSVDLSAYAKLADKEQWLLSKTVVAQGYGFGDTLLPPVALTYTDTGEGYGERLVLAVGQTIEYIPYQSDFEPLKSRLDALESKQAPAADLSAYALKTDLLGLATDAAVSATYVTKADARIYTTAADVAAFAQANYAPKADTYTKVEVDDKFKTYVSATTFTTWGANFYTKTAADTRFALKGELAAQTLQGVSVNDPELAAFRASVLDEVKKMMTGGKTIPADVPWTKLVSAGSSTTSPPEAKVLNGIVYLRGEVVKSIGAGYIANVCQLPATIPAPPKEMVIPLACKNTSPAGRYYGYATFQTNRQIGVSSDYALNTVWLDGISYPAYE